MNKAAWGFYTFFWNTVAAAFAEECRALGFETVSMRDEFETIYKKDAVKTKLGGD